MEEAGGPGAAKSQPLARGALHSAWFLAERGEIFCLVKEKTAGERPQRRVVQQCLGKALGSYVHGRQWPMIG